MKKMWMNWVGCGAVALLTIMTARAEVLLFDLGDVKLSGETGANTFLVKNTHPEAALALDDGNLKWTSAGGQAFTYMLSYFTPQSLNVGDSITLSYTLSAPTSSFQAAANTLRLGLFDSNGNDHITADLDGGSSTLFINNKGFGVGYQPGGGAANGKYGARQANNAIFFGGWTDCSNSPTLTNPAYTELAGTFTITRTDTGVTLSSSIGDTPGSTLDLLTSASGYTTNFDTLSFFTMHYGSNASDFIFKKLSVSLIPEPSVTVLLTAGVILLALIVARRKSRCGC
ncbi:MAG: PEP-CTERM sorting domain-containing protein [Verrucomicrobiales bacterium]|jgi:hypothetical protein|nr:PEP-CTERM sorting domain-containing protein [Verrucomicrobiales bacterium]